MPFDFDDPWLDPAEPPSPESPSAAADVPVVPCGAPNFPPTPAPARREVFAGCSSGMTSEASISPVKSIAPAPPRPTWPKAAVGCETMKPPIAKAAMEKAREHELSMIQPAFGDSSKVRTRSILVAPGIDINGYGRGIAEYREIEVACRG
ncbi:MAG TPA: hypothetical protein VGX78_13935 [Pirellulales bacterium]|nr:hypothetical protein [Pirellulales bacterium]